MVFAPWTLLFINIGAIFLVVFWMEEMCFTPSRGIFSICVFNHTLCCCSGIEKYCTINIEGKRKSIPLEKALHVYPQSDKGKCIRPYIVIYIYMYNLVLLEMWQCCFPKKEILILHRLRIQASILGEICFFF